MLKNHPTSTRRITNSESRAAIGLPAGLSINAASGLISGTPNEAGIFNVLISVANGQGLGVANLLLNIAGNLPIQWSGNGHWYQAIYVGTPGISWPDASAAATNANGYLATITSAEENAFVYALVSDPSFWFIDAYGNGIGPWLGGFQPAGSPEPGGNWQWITGEAMAYLNWAATQPDNSWGIDNRLNFVGMGALQSPKWNDISSAAGLRGYLIEYNQMTGTPILNVSYSNKILLIAWPKPTDGWVLQQTPTLSEWPVPWTTVAPPYPTNTTHHVIEIKVIESNQFYRLFKP